MDLQPVIVADLLADLLAAASGAHFSAGGTTNHRSTLGLSDPGWRSPPNGVLRCPHRRRAAGGDSLQVAPFRHA
jgi:hypothetical protein